MRYDLIIIGSGAAGLGAAIYGGRYRIHGKLCVYHSRPAIGKVEGAIQ